MNISPLAVRSTLYMPATQKDLAQIISNQHKTGADAIVLCFEDALNINDIPKGIRNLNESFENLCFDPVMDTVVTHGKAPYRFIRVRNIENYHLLMNSLSETVLNHIHGIVIPKFTPSNIREWENALHNSPYYIMPTLETEDYYNPIMINEIFNRLSVSLLKNKVLMLRFGGNDLLRGLAMKRPKPVSNVVTIYDTPLLHIINLIAIQARSKGFEVSAPVYEYFNDTELNRQSFEKELALDVAHGFVGKTAIHPSQCEQINKAFSYSEDDLALAANIVENVEKEGLNGGVYNGGKEMIEPTTHYAWAKRLIN